MEPRWCLITGGNSGIGRAAAVQLAGAGHKVTIACRSAERGELARKTIRDESDGGSVELLLVDLSLQASIRRAAERFAADHPRLDVLINNAADFDITRKAPRFTEEGVESVWATNHLGPVLLTSLLRPLLEQSEQGRVINIASKGLLLYPALRVDLDDPEFRSRRYTVQRAYYQSKLAQVMYTYWLAREVTGTKMTANCIRVTNVKIDLERYPNLSKLSRLLYSLKSRSSISPEQMAEAYVRLATSPHYNETNGRYLDEKLAEVDSSPYSRNPEQIEKLMQLTFRCLQER